MSTDLLESAAPTATTNPTTAPPLQTHEDALHYLRDAFAEEERESVPEGWRIYTTQKFVGQALLASYAVTALSLVIAPLLISGSRIPVFFTPEAAFFTAPAIVAGAGLNWASKPEPETAAKRTWKGRALTIALVYLGTLVLAGMFHFAWTQIPTTH